MIRAVVIALEADADAQGVLDAIRMVRGVRAIVAVAEGDAPPTMNVGSSQLKLPKIPRGLSVDDVKSAVANNYRVNRDMLSGKDRHSSIAEARHVAMFICKLHVKSWSYPELGRQFGGRDHTTVISAVRKIEKRVAGDERMRARIDGIVDSLKNTGT